MGGECGNRVLLVEWILAAKFVPVADSTLLIVLVVVAACFMLMAVFAGFTLWLVTLDRGRERAEWAGVTHHVIDEFGVSQEAANLLREYVAQGLRVKQISGRDVLCYPDGTK